MVHITNCSNGLVFSIESIKWKNIVPEINTYNVDRFGISDGEFYELMDKIFNMQKKLIEFSIDYPKKIKFENITFAICFDKFKKMNRFLKWTVMNMHSIQSLQKYGIFVYFISPDSLDSRIFSDRCWELNDFFSSKEA